MTIGYSRVNRDGRITLQKRGNVRCYCNVKLRIGEPEEYILHRQNRPGNERQLSCGSSNSLKSCPKLEGLNRWTATASNSIPVTGEQL